MGCLVKTQVKTNENIDNTVYGTTKKKALKIFSPRTWCAKKLFGYRVAHHGYLLTCCPGDILKLFYTFSFVDYCLVYNRL